MFRVELKDCEVGRRCALGCYTWPDKAMYLNCAVCGEPTERFKKRSPVDEEAAQRYFLELQFEKYYFKHCAQLGIPVDGPLQGET